MWQKPLPKSICISAKTIIIKLLQVLILSAKAGCQDEVIDSYKANIQLIIEFKRYSLTCPNHKVTCTNCFVYSFC